MGPPSAFVLPLAVVPSPHATVHAHGASVVPPGSVKVALRLNGEPSTTLASAPALTAGATLVIVTPVEAGALARPNASVTTSVTA